VINQRPGLGRAVAALQHRDFMLFYIALLAAAIGSQLQSFANVLQIWELTESPLQLGLTGLARAIPVIALSLAGGVIADRVDRVRFIMVTQSVGALFSVVLAGLTVSGHIAVWHIYVITFLVSALSAVNTPARSAIIPNLVPREHLLNAIALNSTVWQTSNILGPMLAGISIAALGFPLTYVINGLVLLGTLGILALVNVGPVAARPRQSPLKGLLEGLAFVRYRSLILVLLGMDASATFFGSYRALLPAIKDQLGVDAAGLGLLTAAPGLGSLVGAALVMVLGNIRYKGLIVAAGILAYCGALVALALSPWFLLSVGVAFSLGVFDSLQATPRNGVIQLITPDDLRGRVSSFQSMLTGGVPSLGQAWSGATASVLGVPLALMAGAAVCATFIVGTLAARPELRASDLGAESREAAKAAEPVPAATA
jgi:MFS family permease